MKHSLFFKNVQPFLLKFILLILMTLITDFMLHGSGLLWIGRYLGIPGTFLIAISFAYSARKKKIITHGPPALFLRLHEYLAWTGALMVLVHGGIHFNALLAWAALTAMLVAVISGLAGKYLLKESRETLAAKKDLLLKNGMKAEEVEKELFPESLTVKGMTKWRTVHRPITIVFAIFTCIHIVTIIFLWR
ncbi:MAG: hypothetical protein HY808_09215 [Nitrospirae bacterium]|nr:hypothetical protein [Nitrospirota bacterium]